MCTGTRAGGSLSAEALAWPQSPHTADIATYCASAGSPTLYDGHLASPPSYRQSSAMLIANNDLSGAMHGRDPLKTIGACSCTPNRQCQSRGDCRTGLSAGGIDVEACIVITLMQII